VIIMIAGAAATRMGVEMGDNLGSHARPGQTHYQFTPKSPFHAPFVAKPPGSSPQRRKLPSPATVLARPLKRTHPWTPPIFRSLTKDFAWLPTGANPGNLGFSQIPANRVDLRAGQARLAHSRAKDAVNCYQK